MNLLLSDPAFLSVAATVSGGGGYDPDAQAYITAVEAADGQALETAVKDAINDFVVGCKADVIWPAIKASCILAGARTLAGALVPLAGTAPTSSKFVSGDYDRKTGLIGSISGSKYLNSNYTFPAGLQDNAHLSVFLGASHTATTVEIYTGASGAAATNQLMRQTSVPSALWTRCNNSTSTFSGSISGASFLGSNRQASSSYITRTSGVNNTISHASTGVPGIPQYVFARNDNNTPSLYTNARLAFYSMGEALDLALLDARVTTLINAFSAAIP